MARPKVREVSAANDIRAVAEPVNTYVRPADPPRSNLHDLAEGLASVDQGLSAFLDKRQAKQNDEDKIKGEAAFNADNQESWAEAVRKGLVPANASPQFMAGWKNRQGQLRGLKLTDEFNLAYQQWEGRNDGDPEAYNQFVTSWLHDHLGDEQDPEVLRGLNPHIAAIVDGGFSLFTKERAEAAYKGSLDTKGAIAADTISTAEADGKSSETGTDYDALWDRLITQREEDLKDGTRAEDYDANLVDLIILEAERSGNPALLKLLDRKLPGQEHAWSSTLDVRKKRDQAEVNIANMQARLATDTAQAREKQEKAQYEAGLTKALSLIYNGEDVPEELIKELSRHNGEARAKIAKFKEDFVKGRVSEDPATLAERYVKIHEGATATEIIGWYNDGIIKDPQTLKDMLDRAEKVQTSRAKGGGIIDDPAATKWRDQFKTLTGASDGGLFGGKDLTDDTMQANYDFDTMLLDWEARNPQASALERRKAINDIGQAIREQITTDPNGLTPGQYHQEGEPAPQATQPAQEAPGAAPAPAATEQPPKAEAAPEAAPGAPQADPNEEAGWSWGDFVPSWLGGGEEKPALGAAPDGAPAAPGPTPAPALDTLTPARRKAVTEFSKKWNVSEDEANRIIHKHLQELGGEDTAPGVDPTITNSIPEASRSKLEALLKNPPKLGDGTASAGNIPVAPLLNLIGKTEGTDKGDGYNETLAYGAFTGGDVDLVNMTLDEVDALQTRMLRHPSNVYDSSAVGRYQIIRTTMRKLRAEMGLTGSEKYDRNLQDRMALQLLKGRGLEKWQSGKMSDAAFMDALSKEWASLPDSAGKGAYKGQRTGVNAAGLLGTLDKVRNAEGVQVASLDPSIGLPQDVPPAYSKIPAKDDAGEDQIAKFMEWNPDPIGNEESNLRSVDPRLAEVIRKAKTIAGTNFVVGSGKRDAAMQEKAVKWGWGHTEDSDHLGGSAADLWPLDEDGAVVFDAKRQALIVKAMKQAAKELGVTLDVGSEWGDKPHFAIKS